MNRKGFTLIELLIVVVIIGILAAIALPKFANTKEKAYLASMKSDLRNLVTAEEAYFADSVKYVDPLPPGTTLTTGVSLSGGKSATDGFWASVSHNATTKTCDIYVGASSAGSVKWAKTEGAPACG
jgi:prepilin-type N-terminal cleavage/methylation domain-containing protein